MGIHDDAWDVEAGAEYDVGGLSTDAVELDEFIECSGHLSPMLFDYGCTRAGDVLGFLPVETAGLDMFLEQFHGFIDVVARGFVLLE